jgi:predicted dehydrogenase
MTISHRPVVRIIGLGNIGFRHLQGLAAMADEIAVEGFDVEEGAVERARAEWENIPSAMGRFSSPADISGPADLTVLATSAVGRETLLESHLAIGSRRFLLEKVVFTDPDAFMRAQHALDAAGAVAYVNTARRLWPLHQKIRGMVETTNAPISLEIAGRNIGLACNGVHFIDLLQMLSGHTDVAATRAEISTPWASKRAGYYEVWGDVLFEAGDARLALSVQPDAPEATTIRLRLGDSEYMVDEASGALKSDMAVVLDAGRAPYQSELSIEYARPMLQDLAPALPSLLESAKAHIALFEAIRPAFENAGLMSGRQIPIT